MINSILRRAIGTLTVLHVLTTCASAQQLANTSWTVYNGSMVVLYMHFDGDTLSYSEDGVDYIDVSTYTDNSGAFTLEDINSNCTGVTGSYYYIVAGDTLHWMLVADTCPTRPTVFLEYHWVSPTTAIAGQEGRHVLDVLPNPAESMITIRATDGLLGERYVLYDGQGSAVCTGKLDGRYAIDVAHLPPGTYVLRVPEAPWGPARVVEL